MILMAGLAMSLMASGVAHAQTQSNKATNAGPHFRLCTGNSSLNYYRAGQFLKKQSTAVHVDVIETKGSMDNLDKIVNGECDGGFVQSDAMMVYSQKNANAISAIERAGVLYKEQAHLICNKAANLGRMVNLTKDMTIAVGPEGSGNRVTWDGFVMADKKRYGQIRVDSRSGERALGAAADGADVTCALAVTAMNSNFMKNEAQKHGDKLVLVGTDDRDMVNTAKDARGKQVYTYNEIPAGTYPKIQPSGTLFGTKPIGTIGIDAIFVSSTKWINENESAYNKVLSAFSSARPDIQKLVTPQ